MTAMGPALDRITRLAAGYFSVPMAAISRIELDKIKLIARHGVEMSEILREGSFSRRRSGAVNPWWFPMPRRMPGSPARPSSDPPRIRFYAGMPLSSSGIRGRYAGHHGHAASLTAEVGRAWTHCAILPPWPRASSARPTAPASLSPRTRANGWTGSPGALPAMVWLTDTAGRCTLLNRFPWDPSGKDGAGNAPCDWRNVIPPEEADGDSKDDLAFECKIQGRDGKDRWILQQARPRFHADGSFAGYIGLCLDITDRKRAETEPIASREQLRQLAAHVESAREEERIRIAREIHDELGQVLTVLKMDLEAVQARYHGSVRSR